MEVIFFDTQAAFRKWLEKNHKEKNELWVGFYKKASGKRSIDWPQSVDEALCFGWIDGIRKSIDDESYKIRFTPRKEKSIWSAKNLKRIEELKELSLVSPAGLEIYNKRDPKYSSIYSFEQKIIKLDKNYEADFKKNKIAWEFFNSTVPSYKKPAVHWVMSAKQNETRLRRLNILIQCSEKGEKIPMLKRPGDK